MVAPAVPHEEHFEYAGQSWHTRWTVKPLADGTFDLNAWLERDGEVLAEPRMVLRDAAVIRIGKEAEDGSFKALGIDLRISAGTPAPGTAAVETKGEVLP